MRRLAALALLACLAPGAAHAAAPAPPAAAPEAGPPTASAPPESGEDEDEWLFATGPDPAQRDAIERTNRLSFALNERFYRYVADPVAKGFAWVVPPPGRRAIHRFFENLESPALLVNDVFQLAPLDATKTTSRFVINTTLGMLGLFDPAEALGIEIHHTDFGETLAVWGAPSGTYFVIPLLGPSTARDTFGELVDAALHPTMWFVSPVEQVIIRTTSGLSAYDIERERLDALRATSVDFYAAIRSAYLLDRDAHVAERCDGRWWRRAWKTPGAAPAK